jgi:hypothetical protein
VGTKGAFPVVRQIGHEAEHSALSSAKVNVRSYTSTPPYVFIVWCLIKDKNDFIFLYISLPLL